MDQSQFEQELKELDGKVDAHFDGWMSAFGDIEVETWSAVFGDMTPSDVYERFAHVAGADNRVSVEILFPKEFMGRKGCYAAEFIVRHNPHPDKEEAQIDRCHFGVLHESYGLGPRCGYMGWALVQEEDQGRHLAKNYMGAVVDLLRDLGMERVQMRATKIGAYAWAKYGFTPAAEHDWEWLSSGLLWRLGEDGRSFHCGDQAYDVSPEMPILQKILGAKFEDLPEVFPQLTELNRVIGERDGRPLTVGKALLIDNDWQGQLLLSDKHPSFQRFQSYVQSATAPQQSTGRA